MNKLFAVSFLSIISLFTTAQVKKPVAATKPATAVVTSRNITITLTPYKNTKIYLGSYLGKSKTLVDSTIVNDKSVGVFKGKKINAWYLLYRIATVCNSV